MELPAEIEIRPAGQDDAGAIVKCLAAAFEPYRAEYSPAAFADTVLDEETVHVRFLQMRVLVATASGNVVGTISGVCHGGEGHLRGMAVLPEWRRLGVAAASFGKHRRFFRHAAAPIRQATLAPAYAAIPIRRIKSCCSALLSAPIVNASRSPNDNAYFKASS